MSSHACYALFMAAVLLVASAAIAQEAESIITPPANGPGSGHQGVGQDQQGQRPYQFHGGARSDIQTVTTGTGSIRDATQAQLETAIRTGLQTAGVDVNAPGVGAFITQQAQGILAGTEDAATVPFITFSQTFTRDANGDINGGTFTWNAPSVSIVSDGVSAQLFQHETGHRLILEDLQRLARTASEQFFARIRGRNLTGDQVTGIFNEIASELLFIHGLANQIYDGATQSGTIGGLHQLTTAHRSFTSAVLIAPILPIPRPEIH